MDTECVVGVTAWLWNSVNDLKVSWLFYELENICTGTFVSIALDFNNITLQIRNDVLQYEYACITVAS